MEKPIRVLQVVTIMNLGGIENFLMSLYRNIDRNKVQFDFLVHRKEKGTFDGEIQSLGGNIYQIDALQPLKYFEYKSKLKSFFKEHPEFRIVHSHLNANSSIVLSIAKSSGIPVRIAHAHIDTAGGRNKYLKIQLKKILTRYSTKNFACAKTAGEWLYGKHPFELFPNSIDPKKFEFNKDYRSSIRKSLGIQDDDFVIGNIARFNHQKNHKFILKIFADYLKINSRSKLLLIGDGELRNEIENKIRDYGITEKVILTGAVKNANEYLNAMDLFLFPSLFEGLPVTLVEAQCNGLSVLMSDSITNEIILTDLIQFKSLSQSSNFWAQEIQQLLENYNENERSKYLNFILNSNYDISKSVKKLEEFYTKEYIRNERNYI